MYDSLSLDRIYLNKDSVLLRKRFKGCIYNFNLKLLTNITIVHGDSGSGKTFLYDLFNMLGDRAEGQVVCYNYINIGLLRDLVNNGGFEFKGKIVIIDNASLVFSKVRQLGKMVMSDPNNQYIYY